MSAKCPRPVAHREWCSGFEFSGVVMNSRDWMSPVVTSQRSTRYGVSSGQSHSRWWEEIRSVPYGYRFAVMFGGGSEGNQLQKTLHIAHVSAQSTPWRWLRNFNEGLESSSSVFHCGRSSVRT